MFYGTGATNKQPQGIKGTSDIVSTTWDAANIYDKILETWAQHRCCECAVSEFEMDRELAVQLTTASEPRR